MTFYVIRKVYGCGAAWSVSALRYPKKDRNSFQEKSFFPSRSSCRFRKLHLCLAGRLLW